MHPCAKPCCTPTWGYAAEDSLTGERNCCYPRPGVSLGEPDLDAASSVAFRSNMEWRNDYLTVETCFRWSQTPHQVFRLARVRSSSLWHLRLDCSWVLKVSLKGKIILPKVSELAEKPIGWRLVRITKSISQSHIPEFRETCNVSNEWGIQPFARCRSTSFYFYPFSQFAVSEIVNIA